MHVWTMEALSPGPFDPALARAEDERPAPETDMARMIRMRDARDQEILEQEAEDLNRELEDVLEHQVDP